MLLTKQNIVSRINQLQTNYRVKWEDIYIDLDMAINKINDYMGTKYPPVSSILDDFSEPEKTYSYRAGGTDVEFFPNKYFMNIVIPFVVIQLLARDEEFTTIYSKYLQDIEENLLFMTANEINNVPSHLIDVPKGVYFPNPDPMFKQNPEKYFNRKIEMPIPRIKVNYSWGDIKNGFVSRPLPIDQNSYEINSLYTPIVMTTNDFNTVIVDEYGTVIATFIGWSLEKQGTEQEVISGYITLTQDVTLYAVFDYDIIRFKFNGNGGTLSNWKPMYLNKNSIPTEGVIPQGGTASRKGYQFFGFSPIKINSKDIEGLILDDIEINPLDGLSKEELEAINETSGEPTIEFTAQWGKILYNLYFLGYDPLKYQHNQGRSKYVYGEEFELQPLVAQGDGGDDFIGWWDNPDFNGEPVLKIYESDLGNKTFYAKFNDSESFTIKWIAEDSSVIRVDTVTKGATLTPPAAPIKPNAYINDLYYSFEFDKFLDLEDGSELGKAKKHQTFVATYTPIPYMTNLYIHYIFDDEGVLDDAVLDPIQIQVGSIISKENLFNMLTGDKSFYTDDVPNVYRLKDFSSIGFEESAIPGNQIIISNTTDINLYALYEMGTVTINIYNETWNEEASALIPSAAPIAEITVAEGIATQSGINLAIDGLLDNEIPVIINDNLYLQGFKIWDSPNKEDLPSNITTTISIITVYSENTNSPYIRELELVGLPKPTDESTFTDSFYYPLGTVIDLEALQASYNIESYQKRWIGSKTNPLDSGFYTDPSYTIEKETITLNSPTQKTTLYVKTYSRVQFKVYIRKTIDNYPNPQTYEDILYSQYYPYQLVSPKTLTVTNSSFGATHNQNSLWLFKGFSYIGPDERVVNDSIVVDNTRTADVIWHPVFVPRSGFKINFVLYYKKTTVFPTYFNKVLNSINLPNNLQNTTYTVFANRTALENAIMSVNGGGSYNANKMIKGYYAFDYKINNNAWQSWDLSSLTINLGQAQETLTEYTIHINLDVSSSHYLLKFGTLYSTDQIPLEELVSGTTQNDLTIFANLADTIATIWADLPNVKTGTKEGRFRFRSKINPIELIVPVQSNTLSMYGSAMPLYPGTNREYMIVIRSDGSGGGGGVSI